jgi:alginate O-acetyltransferase complex protein AlgI
MLFNSFIFLIFLGVVLPVFYALKTKTSKNVFLLVASYIFYGYWDWRFCLLLALSSLIDFLIGQKLHKTTELKKRRGLLALSLISNLGILCFFKYFNFFLDSFQSLSDNFGYSLDYLHLNIILPVGISFYTFQTLSYTIDIYRKRLEPTSNFIDFSLFVAFFPQLVAGPIERAKSLLPQLSAKLKPSKTQINQGVVLIVTGLFRKVMIGDTAGRYVDHIFGNLELYGSVELLCALLLFSIQIYADFSGYSHIARGTAKLLGVELVKNFEQPYFSRNITEFWRRWHISLSSWLKDYLYFSLGGNRKGNSRMYINLMLTMIIGGLWHGASWNFVVWGGLHGLFLLIHKLLLGNRKVSTERMNGLKLRDLFNVLTTFTLVTCTWLFFRSTSWESTELFISKVTHWESSVNSLLFIRIALSFSCVIIIMDWLEYRHQRHTFLLKVKSSGIRYGILFALFLFTLIYMFQADPSPFIYFQF